MIYWNRNGDGAYRSEYEGRWRPFKYLVGRVGISGGRRYVPHTSCRSA